MSSKTYQHWQLQRDQQQILWLTFDRQEQKVNSINLAVLAELDNIITDIENDPKLAGVIITSAKKTGFITGADIESFKDLNNLEQAMELINNGQQVFARFASLKLPTVALISGPCLGGGLELALACDYRIVEDQAKTKLGLPEVKLGIQPGWGGSVRLPRLIGARLGLELMLSGRAISASQAKRYGLADAAVPERQLRRAAVHYVTKKPARKRAPKIDFIFNFALVRQWVAKFLRMQLAKKKVRQAHYPAPFAMIDNWAQYGVNDEQAFVIEAQSIGRLFETDTAKNLVRVFFLQGLLKKSGNPVEFKAQRVHVIGAGTMGGDIAAWCALRGFLVTLQDREPKYIAPAIARAYKLFKKKLKKPRLINEAMDRLIPDVNGLGVKGADVIIEAIYENLEAKQKLFKELEATAKSDAILATNTSSIPLDEINTALQNPARLVGIHFFNPVAMMQLVEVVQGQKTDQQTVDKAIAFVRKIVRLPLVVTSTPGFLVNRILLPYLMEAVTLLDEKVPAQLIDEAAERFGMPMGPVELADRVGLDVCLSVADNLAHHFGGQVPARLKEKVQAGELGTKSGKGFYSYKKGKALKPNLEQSPNSEQQFAEISDRLILRLENEAVACLREKVVQSADLLDAGMIFGTGFAPFRGGPIHYAQTKGVLEVTEQLQRLQSQHGERFQADAKWQELAND